MDGQWTGVVTIIVAVVGSAAYLRGRIEGLRDEVRRQNGVDRDLFTRVNRMVEKGECRDNRNQLRRELKS